MRRLTTLCTFLIASLLALASPLRAQAADTTIVCTQCVPVDSTARVDSTVVRVDTTWAVSTHWTVTYRDSLVITPRVLDTTGFRPLAAVIPTKQGDKGTGPVTWLGNGTWVGQMYFDSAAPAPYTNAIRWFYRDGCWGGVSPGYSWFENGLAGAKVHDLYYTAYVRVSDNWVGHAVGTKLMLIGWGVNGNQFILRQSGSPNSATGTLWYQIAWQGGSTAFPGRVLKGSGKPTSVGSWNVTAYATQPRGQWQKIEIQTHAGPQGTGTSWIKLVVNGVLVAHIDQMDFMNWAGDPYVSAVKQSPVWGGGTSCTAPGGQNLWFSGIRIYGK